MRTVFIALLFTSCVPLATPNSSSESINLFTDSEFIPTIKTVQLYPNRNEVSNVLLSPSVSLFEQNLVLSFDDLVSAYRSYTIKITHCNADWSKSSLSNLDFLSEFNSFPVTQYAFSSDTHIPYVHYWFQLPPVKLSGNYILTAYLDDTTPAFSRRFFVYGKDVQVAVVNDISGASQLQNKQGISLLMRYSKIPVMNPTTQFEVCIRQNQRWDNIITNLPPAFFRDDKNEIEYLVNDESYMHNGGNEYRFIDLRSILNTGQNIAKVERSTKPFQAWVNKDQPRTGERYSQYLDFNGDFVIQNYDNPLQYSENYVRTIFTLPYPSRHPKPVHLVGALTNNTLSKNSLMRYDSLKKEYTKELLLKQGWYNYQYVIQEDAKPFQFEGNHFETENSYEIFVYYKSLQPRADLLVGYLVLTKNRR